MWTNKMKTILTEEDGSGLVLALMVLLVMSVLGASLGIVTVGSYRLSDINRDNNSAYYIAEAGANMAYEEIENGVVDVYEEYGNDVGIFFNEIDYINNQVSLNGYGEEDFELQSGNQPSAKIEVTQTGVVDNTRKYSIESTATVGNNSRTVEKYFEIEWRKKDSSGAKLPTIPPGASAIINNHMKLNNGYITGDVYLDSESKHSFEISNAGNISIDKVYTSYLGDDLSHIYKGSGNGYKNKIGNTCKMPIEIPWDGYHHVVESIEFPNLNQYPKLLAPNEGYNPIINGDILITDYRANNFMLNFKEDYHSANNLVIQSNWNLLINTNNRTINLIVNNLDIQQGHMKIVGDGTLNIFVLDNLNINGSINLNGDSSKLNILYNGEETLTLDGASKVNGGIFIGRSDLKLTASGNMSGPILSNGLNVTVDGGSINEVLILAPKATVGLSGSGTINGVLIADKLEMSGDPRINYREYNFNDFPFGSNPEEGSNKIPDDLICTQPAIESD